MKGLSRSRAAAAMAAATLLTGAPSIQAASPVSGKTIVVDPGHGGRDPGAIANGVQEKSVTLAIGQQVAAVLRSQGAKVVMTRDSDTTPAPKGSVDDDLQARVNLAQQAHADAFISIHANEAADPAVNGVTTFYGPACGFYSGVTLSATDVGRSASLASKVDAAVVARTHQRDNGVQSVAFWVLGDPGVPSILVETAFLSNPAEAARLADAGFQRLMAEAVGDGVNAYFASGDAKGNPAPPSAAMAGCSGSAPKDDRSQPKPVERWVQTFLTAPLLSGPDAKAKQFTTLAPFSYLKVLSQNGSYFYVLNPDTNGPGFVEAAKVGPSGPPPAPPQFEPFWVESFRPTQLWSGEGGGAISFGPLPTWSFLQVLAPSDSARFYVRIAATGNVAYVDRADVGPSGPPPSAPAEASAPSKNDTKQPDKPQPEAGTVVVAAGDTVSRIAARAGVSVAALIAANHLDADGRITVGQKLVIPGGGTPPASSTGQPSPQPAAASVTVSAGDTVSAIAGRLGVSVADLIAANHLGPDGLITVGQTLVAPSGGSRAAPPPAGSKPPPTTTVTIAPGDTLSAIAARYGTSVQTLVALNKLSSPDDIQAGQTLTVAAA